MCACAFTRAALDVNIVEQPARGSLDARPIVREWIASNRGGLIPMALLALISAFSGYAAYFRSGGDVRRQLGATIILASWPYAYLVMTPVNILIYVVRRNAPASPTRKLMRDWDLLECGQTTIGVAAAVVLGWPIALPP